MGRSFTFSRSVLTLEEIGLLMGDALAGPALEQHRLMRAAESGAFKFAATYSGPSTLVRRDELRAYLETLAADARRPAAWDWACGGSGHVDG